MISWSDPDDGRVIGYLVSRYVDPSPDRRDAAEFDKGETLVFEDRYVIDGKTYIYEIRSRDSQYQLSEPLELRIKIEKE